MVCPDKLHGAQAARISGLKMLRRLNRFFDSNYELFPDSVTGMLKNGQTTILNI